MRVLAAPNAFRDWLTARQAAAAMAAGIQSDADVDQAPLSDGGDGLLDALREALGGELVPAEVQDPLRRPVQAFYLYSPSKRLAVVEMAEASGLRRVAEGERDAFGSSTFGTGQLIAAALSRGPATVLVGAGGSATLDGGAGALAALGCRLLGSDGAPVEPAPRGLRALASVDVRGLDPRLDGIKLRVLPDVRSPLRDNLRHFGRQKGIREADGPRFIEALERLDSCARHAGFPLLDAPWGGAGGGLSGGLAAFARGRLESGALAVAELIGLPDRIAPADLVITGEGRLDSSSLLGKATGTTAQLCAEAGVDCVILAGEAEPGIEARLPAGTEVEVLGGRSEEALTAAAARAVARRAHATRR